MEARSDEGMKERRKDTKVRENGKREGKGKRERTGR